MPSMLIHKCRTIMVSRYTLWDLKRKEVLVVYLNMIMVMYKEAIDSMTKFDGEKFICSALPQGSMLISHSFQLIMD
uniref:Uncharacterized protein n=1 Tax=Nelumbo nucifera TaxID=4432 RepID=A0A822YQY6_NELNU|nr:TPA_asm: hypothetical protein HUJ06_005193 [Nelumbo nucifera]